MTQYTFTYTILYNPHISIEDVWAEEETNTIEDAESEEQAREYLKHILEDKYPANQGYEISDMKLVEKEQE